MHLLCWPHAWHTDLPILSAVLFAVLSAVFSAIAVMRVVVLNLHA